VRFHDLNMEVIPFKQIRKQAKARPPIPTASFKGKTILITGANGSFGAVAAQIFADHEVDTLILACRDVAKGEAVTKAIDETTKSEPKPKILVWALDLASFSSVREFGKRAATLESLDAVILNAALFNDKKKITPEGWETSAYNLPPISNLSAN
jgi:NAD(P)-dependent dehydrogenase (short-subunit alcohol dehydrogenase family)